MVVDIDLETEEATVIEPMTDGDIAMAESIIRDLYHLYEKRQRRKEVTPCK